MYSSHHSEPSAEAQNVSKKLIRSTLVSRNVTIAGHRTSVRLEPDMWSGLMEVCRRERLSVHDVCTKVAQGKNADTSLTAAIRVYVMNYYRQASTEEGHFKAGHGTNARMSVPVHAAHVAGSLPAATSGPSLQPPASRTTPSAPFMIGMSRMNSNGSIR